MGRYRLVDVEVSKLFPASIPQGLLPVQTMEDTIINTLDDVSIISSNISTSGPIAPPLQIASTRSSLARRERALSKLERLLMSICASPSNTSQLHIFLDLQSSFETNGKRQPISRGRTPQTHISVVLRASRVTFGLFTCFLDASPAQRPQYREQRRSPGLDQPPTFLIVRA